MTYLSSNPEGTIYGADFSKNREQLVHPQVLNDKLVQLWELYSEDSGWTRMVHLTSLQ